MAGLSFPRRLGVRFDPDYVTKKTFVGASAKFRAFTDKTFTKQLDEDFDHDDTVSRMVGRNIILKVYSKIIKVIYVWNYMTVNHKMLIDTFYFEFVKTYQLDVTGRKYLEDPILGDRIVKDGILYELEPTREKIKRLVKL